MNRPPPDNPDSFADQLRAQPPAALPPPWRTEILAAALDASARTTPLWRAAAEEIASWLWPRPLAWSILAAGWMIVFMLRSLTPAVVPVSGGAVARWSSGRASGHPDLPQIFADARLASLESAAWDKNEGWP